MALTIEQADEYIKNYFIDNEEWFNSDGEKKQRIINVAKRILEEKCEEVFGGSDFVLPDEAVYEFSAVLSVVFSDVNRLQQHGIAGFSITGVGSYTFKKTTVTSSAGESLDSFIPKRVYRMIGKANGNDSLGKRRIYWTEV